MPGNPVTQLLQRLMGLPVCTAGGGAGAIIPNPTRTTFLTVDGNQPCPAVTDCTSLCRSQVESGAFVVGDLGAIMRQHERWRSLAPHLQPYYPVKCNSSPAVVEVLASLGLGFVCTNKVCLAGPPPPWVSPRGSSRITALILIV